MMEMALIFIKSHFSDTNLDHHKDITNARYSWKNSEKFALPFN